MVRIMLTLIQRDTDFIELDKSESPLSVYLPSRGGCSCDNHEARTYHSHYDAYVVVGYG